MYLDSTSIELSWVQLFAFSVDRFGFDTETVFRDGVSDTSTDLIDPGRDESVNEDIELFLIERVFRFVEDNDESESMLLLSRSAEYSVDGTLERRDSLNVDPPPEDGCSAIRVCSFEAPLRDRVVDESLVLLTSSVRRFLKRFELSQKYVPSFSSRGSPDDERKSLRSRDVTLSAISG